MVQDHTHFVREGGVVADAIGNGARQNMAVAVFVLQAFAVQSGSARCTAQQEATRLHVASRPCQIANALETKHGIVNIERHHDAVAGGVAGGCCNPARHTARFVNALLQNLARFVFFVVHHLVFINRCVLLTRWVVNTDLAEQTFHAKGTRFVYQNGNHAGAQSLVAQELCEETHIGLRGGNFTAFHSRLHDRFKDF